MLAYSSKLRKIDWESYFVIETQPFTRMWWHTAQRWTGQGVHLRSLQSAGGKKGEYSYSSTEAQRSGMGLGISPVSGVIGFLTEGHVTKAGWPGVHACVVHAKAKPSLTSMSPTHLTLTISHHHSCPGTVLWIPFWQQGNLLLFSSIKCGSFIMRLWRQKIPCDSVAQWNRNALSLS